MALARMALGDSQRAESCSTLIMQPSAAVAELARIIECAGPADGSGNSGWQAAKMHRDRMDYRVWALHAEPEGWDGHGAGYIAEED